MLQWLPYQFVRVDGEGTADKQCFEFSERMESIPQKQEYAC